MKQLLTSIAIVIITLALVLATSLLLEIHFIKAQVVRQIVIYILIAMVAFIGFRILYLYNYKK